MRKQVEHIQAATVLFAGDSGDGSQTIGAQMTETSAIVGNDVATLPDYPAEIKAPAGSLAGVLRLPTTLLQSNNTYTR